MAGIKIDNFAIGDVNLSAIMDTLQGLKQGHFQASLTEMDTTTIPKIAAGSIFDLNGSFVYIDADETIGGTPVDGVTYVKAIYSSGAVSFEWTATAPTFATDKNGWYGTGASSGHRYIAKMIKASSSYTGKLLYDSANIPSKYEMQLSNFTGSWNTGSSKTATLTFLTNVKSIKTLNINSMVTSLDSVKIDSVIINTNTITISLTNTGGSATYSHYSILCVAEIE